MPSAKDPSPPSMSPRWKDDLANEFVGLIAARSARFRRQSKELSTFAETLGLQPTGARIVGDDAVILFGSIQVEAVVIMDTVTYIEVDSQPILVAGLLPDAEAVAEARSGYYSFLEGDLQAVLRTVRERIRARGPDWKKPKGLSAQLDAKQVSDYAQRDADFAERAGFVGDI